MVPIKYGMSSAETLRGCVHRSGLVAQRGASLIIALVLLSLLALLVLGSFNLSSSNLQAVSNMQRRDEALAAATRLLEAEVAVQLKTIGGQFKPPVASTAVYKRVVGANEVDDFSVSLEKPICIEWVKTGGSTTESGGSSVSLGYMEPNVTSYDTLWEFRVTATDASGLGAKVVIVDGVRAILNETQKTTHCP